MGAELLEIGCGHRMKLNKLLATDGGSLQHDFQVCRPKRSTFSLAVECIHHLLS